MKNNKTKRIQFRVSDEDYIYFQHLKEKEINISKHVLLSVKTTNAYKNYYKHING
jgi:hypothetical protein